MRDAISGGDLQKLRSVLARDYAEEDVASGEKQAMTVISDLLSRAAVRPTPPLSRGTKPGFSAQGNKPPFWDFDLMDIRIVALYGGLRATVTCEAVMHAFPFGYSSDEREAGGGIRREIQLEFEKAGGRWLLRSSDNLVHFLRDAVEVMEGR